MNRKHYYRDLNLWRETTRKQKQRYYWEWFVDFAQKATEKDLILIGGDLDFEGTMGWTRQQGEEYLHAPRRIRFDIPTIVKYVDNFSFGGK